MFVKSSLIKLKLINKWLFKRCASNQFNLVHLTNRTVIKLKGKDTFSYLQLLITNNLQQNLNCINCYLTTPNSKILCDFLVYKLKGDVFDKELILNGLTYNNYGKKYVDCLNDLYSKNKLVSKEVNDFKQTNQVTNYEEEIVYLECDTKLAQSIKRTLFVRKVREDVTIDIMPNLKVYCLYRDFDENENTLYKIQNEYLSEYFCFVNDPRTLHLGQRVVSVLDINKLKLVLNELYFDCNLNEVNLDKYIQNRFKIGIGEGYDDHENAKTFILHFNGDLLNGLNFYKGGFVGCIPSNRVLSRKNNNQRTLPIEFEKKFKLPKFCEFVNFKNKKVGYLLNKQGNYGIGIFQLNSAFYDWWKNRNSNEIKDNFRMTELRENIHNTKVLVKIPKWWKFYENSEIIEISFEKNLPNQNKLITNH